MVRRGRVAGRIGLMAIIGNRDRDLPGDQRTQFGAEQGGPDAGQVQRSRTPTPSYDRSWTTARTRRSVATATAASAWIPGRLPAGALLVAGWLYVFAPVSAPPGVTLADLHGVGDLQARFNADRGQPRLLVIFSPT
jgi:hypothetical protein